ncbi:MAG TPA: HAMP domain-containing sensor histidine kinase [Pyrinomonadaceae bacterium]
MAGTSQDESGLATQDDAKAIADDNTQLRRLSDYRTLMLASITHELRTPLTAILGFAEILLDFEKLTESQREFCEKIQNSGKQLQSTINLLSDLTNLSPGGSESVVHEFSPGSALRESCAAVSRRAEKKSVVLVCNIDNAFASVVSDESQVRQVLFNFLAYAIARSPIGGRVTSTVTTAANSDVLFKINDEGEPVDLSRGLDFAAVGSDGENPNLHQLGLEISRQLLQALGGTVTLENREPQGLEIAVKLPAHPSLP